jgi:predicted short-subunit dehydrogenase-like oxidoreductase (DUF2520 family)
MKVVVIGAGNVATHLAKAMQQADLQIDQIWSHQYKNSEQLAKEVNAKPIVELSEINKQADLAVVSIKDDAIAEIATQLREFKGCIVHTSGSVNINVFSQIADNYGVLYPLQTFSKNKEINFSNVPLCLEANNQKTLQLLHHIASLLSNSVFEIDSQKRTILHLAAVFACNFTNHMYALANQIVSKNDLPFDILKPLITETAAKVQNALPLQVQTGPAVRHDETTLQKHEELLKQMPQLLEIYKTLSEDIKNQIS